MTIKEILNKIRKEQIEILSLKHKFYKVLSFLILGVILGVISKYSDTIPSSSDLGYIWNLLRDITTGLGLWIFLATIISAWSKNPKEAAIKVLVFFMGMLIAYYIYSMKLFGFFPKYCFLRWFGIALFSPLAAYIVWFSRGDGWIAGLCAALPIGLLISIKHSFLFSLSVLSGFELILGSFELISPILLFLILPKSKKQYLRIFILIIFVVLFFVKSRIFFYIFSGL